MKRLTLYILLLGSFFSTNLFPSFFRSGFMTIPFQNRLNSYNNELDSEEYYAASDFLRLVEEQLYLNALPKTQAFVADRILAEAQQSFKLVIVPLAEFLNQNAQRSQAYNEVENSRPAKLQWQIILSTARLYHFEHMLILGLMMNQHNDRNIALLTSKDLYGKIDVLSDKLNELMLMKTFSQEDEVSVQIVTILLPFIGNNMFEGLEEKVREFIEKNSKRIRLLYSNEPCADRSPKYSALVEQARVLSEEIEYMVKKGTAEKNLV